MVAVHLHEALFQALQTTLAEDRRLQLRQVVQHLEVRYIVAHKPRSRKTKPPIRAVQVLGTQVQALHLAAQVAATAAEEVAEAVQAVVTVRAEDIAPEVRVVVAQAAHEVAGRR